MAELERTIQEAVVQYAREKYKGVLIARKFAVARSFSGAPTGETGWPDFEFIVKAKPWPYVFMIEFKAPGGKPTPKQMEMINRLRALGTPVYVCDDRVAGRALVDSQVHIAQGRPLANEVRRTSGGEP